jgi:type IV secretory pathway VirB10-like protein
VETAAETSRCPNCGAVTTSGQNVCIECGHDLRRTYGRAPYTRAWIAAGVVAVLAIGVGAGFAIGSLTNDKQKKEARQVSATSSSNSVPAATAVPPEALHQPTAPVTPTPTAPTAPTTPTTPPPSAPPATATPTTPSKPSPSPSSGAVASWPAGKTAYTLVLISAKSRKQAFAKAREAKSRGIDAGVLHSNDYSSLNPGYWVVFVGQYKTVGQARSHIDEYASKGFPGGYPRQIKK